jgi:hypothetical protein
VDPTRRPRLVTKARADSAEEQTSPTASGAKILAAKVEAGARQRPTASSKTTTAGARPGRCHRHGLNLNQDNGEGTQKRRRSRLAIIVPPVPPPRITICFRAMVPSLDASLGFERPGDRGCPRGHRVPLSVVAFRHT